MGFASVIHFLIVQQTKNFKTKLSWKEFFKIWWDNGPMNEWMNEHNHGCNLYDELQTLGAICDDSWQGIACLKQHASIYPNKFGLSFCFAKKIKEQKSSISIKEWIHHKWECVDGCAMGLPYSIYGTAKGVLKYNSRTLNLPFFFLSLSLKRNANEWQYVFRCFHIFTTNRKKYALYNNIKLI